jgi:hypothetical protein
MSSALVFTIRSPDLRAKLLRGEGHPRTRGGTASANSVFPAIQHHPTPTATTLPGKPHRSSFFADSSRKYIFVPELEESVFSCSTISPASGAPPSAAHFLSFAFVRFLCGFLPPYCNEYALCCSPELS